MASVVESTEEMPNSCGYSLFDKNDIDKWTTGWPEAILFTGNFTFTVIGIFANSFGLLFFIKKQRKDITTLLFIALCAVDLATVLTLGPFQLLINAHAINFYDFTTQHFTIFSIISTLANIEIRFSMFLFMVMSFCRCISVISPFRRHNSKLVLSILFVYLVGLFVMCIYPVCVCSDMSYTIVPFSRLGQMEFLSVLERADIRVEHHVYLGFMEIATMYIPVIPITITSCITAIFLLFSPSMKSNNSSARRDGAITILILTFTTLLCYTPRLAFSMSAYEEIAEYTVADKIITGVGEHWACFVMYILITGLNIANSGINPCIFLIRGQNMKTYLQKSVSGAYRRSTMAIRGNSATASMTLSSVLANKSVTREEQTALSLKPINNTNTETYFRAPLPSTTNDSKV